MYLSPWSKWAPAYTDRGTAHAYTHPCARRKTAVHTKSHQVVGKPLSHWGHLHKQNFCTVLRLGTGCCIHPWPSQDGCQPCLALIHGRTKHGSHFSTSSDVMCGSTRFVSIMADKGFGMMMKSNLSFKSGRFKTKDCPSRNIWIFATYWDNSCQGTHSFKKTAH